MAQHGLKRIAKGSYVRILAGDYSINVFKCIGWGWKGQIFEGERIVEEVAADSLKETAALILGTASQMTHTVKSAYNGAICEESIMTPWSCSVASETYWCS